jgi:hypothetical protein
MAGKKSDEAFLEHIAIHILLIVFADFDSGSDSSTDPSS